MIQACLYMCAIEVCVRLFRHHTACIDPTLGMSVDMQSKKADCSIK